MKLGRRPRPIAERLNKQSYDDGECRLWSGFLNDGYGRITIDGKYFLAHRVAYEVVKGPIPEGMEIDHACFNRACIAIDHLRLATRQENARHKQGAASNSVSGIRGVSTVTQCGRTRYRALVQTGGTTYHLGMFDTPEEAGRVAAAGREELFGKDFS